MNKTKVKQLILKNIQKMGWLSYPQLLRILKTEGVNIEGGFQLTIEDKNVVLWGGLSEVVVSSINELMKESLLRGLPAPIELYQIEGTYLNHPLILQVPPVKLEHPAVFLTYLTHAQDAEGNILPLVHG